MHDLDIDGSDIDTALPDDDDDVVSFDEFSAGIRCSLLVSGGSVFLFCSARGTAPSFLGSVDGVFA